MCQYRYYYYGGCRHSETRLFEFCPAALVVGDAADEHAPALESEILQQGKHLPHPPTRHPSGQGQGSGAGSGNDPAQPAGVGERVDLPISLKLFTDSSTSLKPAAASSFDGEAASSIPAHSSYETDVAEHEMAGLAAFSGSTFRQFMTVPVAARQYSAEQKHTQSPIPSLRHLRPTQTGIREHTDESCDLPKSDYILQHLSESYRLKDALEFDSEAFDGFNDLEAEIDQLKEDVSRLREEADPGRGVPSSEPPQIPREASASPQRSTLPVLSEQKETSAAARLQRMHEETERQSLKAKGFPPQKPPQPPPPSPMDFPILGSPIASVPASVSSNANTTTDVRRPSYADAAMSGLPKQGDAATPRPSLASQESTEEDFSVIVSPSENKDTVTDKTRRAPHFAQPTQSYARRAGETLRKEAVPLPTKTAVEVGSSKPVKGKEPTLAAEKGFSQRQQKRKSLPEDWMNEPGGQDVSPTSEAATESVIIAVTGKQKVNHSALSTKNPGRSTGLTLKTDLSPPLKTPSTVTLAQQSPRLHKKTSSYMSPTSATTQRIVATLGKERPKRDSPSPKKRAPKLDVSPARQSVIRSPDVGPSASDTSSVQLILDRPTALVAVPTSRTGSPVAQYLEEQQAGRASPVFGSPRGSLFRQARKSRTIEHFCSSGGSTDQYSPQQGPSPDYRTLHSMPCVENTTTVRRASNNLILRPILARLTAEGLARENFAHSSISPTTTAANVSIALNSARDGMPPSMGRSRERPDILASARQSGPLPPHMRSQQRSDGFSTCDVQTQPTQRATSLAPPEDVAPSFSSPYSSLRATASEFTPMQQPMATDALGPSQGFESQQPQGPPPYSIEELTAFRTPEEWMSIPLQQKMMINRLRTLTHHQRPRYSSEPTWNRYNTYSGTSGPLFGFTAVDDNGSPQFVQAGEKLKTNTFAGRKTVHWSLEDGNDEETPVKFGRAAAPPVFAIDSPHPTLSPTSDDTSPLGTPRTPARPWSIGSATSRLPYVWTGGDGKEIRFVGYGPHAERDPNRAIDFDFHGRQVPLSNVAASVENNKENMGDNPTGSVAPRSQKQWAQKLGLDRVPCEKVLIAQATEMMPFAGQLAGWCYDCAAGQ